MRIMGALTPEEQLAARLEELLDLQRRIELEKRRIHAALRRTNPNGRPPSPRPPCNTEKGYQRHYREGEHCDPCLAAHRRKARADYAAMKLRESVAVESGAEAQARYDIGVKQSPDRVNESGLLATNLDYQKGA